DTAGKPPVGILQALERPVLGPGRLDESLSHASHTLVVARLHAVVARADDLREPRSALYLDRVLGERAEHLAVALVADRVGQVLDEVADADDVQELESATDGQRRNVALERPPEQRHLTRVAMRL